MFADYEESRTKGQPVIGYLFRYGVSSGSYYAYTDAEDAFSFGGVTFRPVPIRCAAIKSSGTLDKSLLEVAMAYNLEVPELFRIYPPSRPVTLSIMHGHSNDPDGEFLTAWSGRVLSCGFDEPATAKLSCEPVGTSLRRAGLHRRYQIGCPHQLYGPSCRADREAATMLSEAIVVTSTSVKLPPDWNGSFSVTKFIGGTIRWDISGETEVRTIVRVAVDGRTLSLSGLSIGLVAGAAVEVSLYCNHQLSDCGDLHNNLQNYGGQAWIPLKNPFGFINLF